MNAQFGNVRNQIGRLWLGLTPLARYAIAGALVLISLGLLFVAARHAGPGSYEVLYSGLRPEDAAELVSALDERGALYELRHNGREIWVPPGEVAGLRLALAADGLPRGGVVGFEAFNETRLGMTDFERQVRYQMALQGELTRTIRAFTQVEDARVHIALPERSLFVGQQREASASVVLSLRPGASLGPSQVRAVVHLLAHSVEGLAPDHVTVVDTRGNVLTDTLLSESAAGTDAVERQFEVQRLFERALEQDLQHMLERVYGPGRVVARVNADINFDHFEEQSELFSSPTGGRTGIARSEQLFEERWSGEVGAALGVAGVESNIPGYVSPDTGGAGDYERREETINYELNRTVVNRREAPGGVRRISVAVLIDGDLDADARAQIAESVSAVSGLQPARGDVVSVQSMRFEAVPATAGLVALPDGEPRVPLGVTSWYLVALALVLGVGLAIGAWLRRPAARSAAASLQDEPKTVETLPDPERRRQLMHDRVQSLAKEQPEELAKLLKGWLISD